MGKNQLDSVICYFWAVRSRESLFFWGGEGGRLSVFQVLLMKIFGGGSSLHHSRLGFQYHKVDTTPSRLALVGRKF